MAITFVGSYASTHSSTSAQTINFTNLKNAGGSTPTLQQNDIVVTSVFQAANTTNGSTRTAAQLTPTGYTGTTASSITSTDTNLSSLLVSYKQMGATPDTSITIPASSSTGAGLAYSIHVFRGVSKASPLDVTPTTATGINTAQPNPPAITPSTAGAWIYCVGGGAMASGAAAQSTAPTGLDSTTNAWQTALITSTTSDAAIGVGYNSSWSSGAFDCPAYTGFTTTNTGSWAAETLALAPNQAYLFAPTAVTYALTVEAATLTYTPVLAKASTLKANFDSGSLPSTLAHSGTSDAVVSVSGGVLNVTCLSGTGGHGTGGVTSVAPYDFTGGDNGVYVRFTCATSTSSGMGFSVAANSDGSSTAVWLFAQGGGNIQFGHNTSTGGSASIVTATYSSTNHGWIRLRYDSSATTWYAETAPASEDPPATWTTFGTASVASVDTNLGPLASAGYISLAPNFFGIASSDTTYTYDGLNEATTATTSYTLTATQASYSFTPKAVVLDTAVHPTAVSYSLITQAVTLKLAFNPTATTYALTTQATGLIAARKLTAIQASYALTPTAPVLNTAVYPTAASYTLSTQATGLKAARQFNPTAVAYALTSQSVIQKLAFNPTAASYALTGQTIGLNASKKLNPTFVSYTLTAEVASTTTARRLNPAVTTYSLTGENVTFVSGTGGLSAGTANYTLTGETTALDTNRKLSTAETAFAFTQYSVTLSYGEDASAGTYVLATSSSSSSARQYVAAGVVISDDNTNQFVASGSFIEEAAPSAPLYVLTAENVSTTLGYSLIAASASYSLTGTTTNLAASRDLAATQASYTLTRSAASVRHNYSFAPSTVTYNVSGSATLGSALDPTAASYSLTGTTVSLKVGRAVAPTAVHYTLTSESVIFSDVLPVSTVSYSLTTFAASLNLITSKGINPTSASYVLTTEAAVLQTSRQLAVTATAYAVTAEAVTLAAGEPFSTANYAVTASSTTLTVTRQQSVTTATYSLTSASTRLAIARDLNVSAVVYVVSVFGATHGYGLAPTSVPYTLSRFSSSLIATRDLRPSVRTYALGGFSASLRSARLHSPTTQTYAVTGQSAVLLSGIQLSASYASYTLTPYSIVFKAATKLMLADVCILHTIPISAYPTHKVPATHRRRQVFTM